VPAAIAEELALQHAPQQPASAKSRIADFSDEIMRRNKCLENAAGANDGAAEWSPGRAS
jgi:hypothetical protein